MRFVSHIRKFGVRILSPVTEAVGPGVTREIRPGLTASFKAHDLTAEDVRVAERLWSRVHGRTIETDQVTATDLKGRLSTYDTESEENLKTYDEIDRAMEGQHTPDGRATWGPGTTKRLVEEKLARRADGTSFALVEAPPVPAPWPRYDQFPGTVVDLLEVLDEQGHSLEQTLAYEKQSLARPEVIVALEGAIQGRAHGPAEDTGPAPANEEYVPA